MAVEGEWLVVDADGRVGRFFTWDLGPLLGRDELEVSVHDRGELARAYAGPEVGDDEEVPTPPWFEYLDEDQEQVYERDARGMLAWDDLPEALRDKVTPLRVALRFAEHSVLELNHVAPDPDAEAGGHWAVRFLDRIQGLDVPSERWPKAAKPFASDGHPIKMFLDGRLALRLIVDDDGGITVEFLTGADEVPKGSRRRRAGWVARFAPEARPDEPTMLSWLELLGRFGQPAPEGPADGELLHDDAWRWGWKNHERLLGRALYDRDRLPFSDHLREAFGALEGDEQQLLQAQWEREESGEGPTVAEQLGWSGKKVMDTYRSAMTKLKGAAEAYRRPRRPKR